MDNLNEKDKVMYEKIGHLTRTLHDALRQLGYNKAIEVAAHSIPDARDRLAYVLTMTEQAANKTLNTLDNITPLPDKISTKNEQMYELLKDKVDSETLAKIEQINMDNYNDLQLIKSSLTDIMMAQDFQDLTGQVIKKIVDMADFMESSLYDFLVEFAPKEAEHIKHHQEHTLMNGPVVNHDKAVNVVSNQEQVDDLLASLGF